MKRNLLETFFLLLFLLAAATVGTQFKISPCDNPIPYRIGTVDARFNISKSEFQTDISQAVGIWDTAESKQLLDYDSKGSLSISLVFDQRQQLTNEINSLQNQVSSQKGTIDQQIAQYQKDKAAFEQKINDLNSQIQSWNAKGGAPPDVYANLVQQQQALKTQAQQLNITAQNLNQSTTSYNSQIGQLDQTITTFNQSLAQKPEEGLYNSRDNTITIYFSNNQNELIHTLAHELGHAIGMDHNQNPNSIMYPYSTSSIEPSKDDLLALSSICEKKSLITIGEQRISLLIQILRQKYIQN